MQFLLEGRIICQSEPAISFTRLLFGFIDVLYQIFFNYRSTISPTSGSVGSRTRTGLLWDGEEGHGCAADGWEYCLPLSCNHSAVIENACKNLYRTLFDSTPIASAEVSIVDGMLHESKNNFISYVFPCFLQAK